MFPIGKIDANRSKGMKHGQPGMNQREAGRSHREAELTFSESHRLCGSESTLVHKFHMQCLRWRRSPFQVICPLSSAGVLDNASLYLLPSRLRVITCVLVGDNLGIGFLIRWIAPCGENG